MTAPVGQKFEQNRNKAQGPVRNRLVRAGVSLPRRKRRPEGEVRSFLLRILFGSSWFSVTLGARRLFTSIFHKDTRRDLQEGEAVHLHLPGNFDGRAPISINRLRSCAGIP